MKLLCAVLCCLMTEYLSADLMDTLVSETLHVRGLLQNPTTENVSLAALKGKDVLKRIPNGQTRSHSKNTQQRHQVIRKQNVRSPKSILPNNKDFLSRKALFAENSIKSIYLSPDAKTFAYIAKDPATKLDTIHILPIQNKGAFGTVINDGVSVLEMAFVGNDTVVYTYADDSQNIILNSVNLSNGRRRDITPIRNAHRMHVFSGQNGIITICNNGKQYFTHKIDVTTGKSQLLKQAQTPMIALFDRELVPTVVYKNAQGTRADVYVNAVIINGNTGEKYVDSIDMSKEKYVSATASSCHKLKEIENKIYLYSRSLSNGQWEKRLIPHAESIRNCTVHLDRKGRITFISVKRGRTHHVIYNPSVKQQIEILSDKFSNSDWSKIGESDDGKIWMICVQNPKKPTEYYLFSTTTGHIKSLISSNPAANKLKLRNTSCEEIQVSNNRSLIGYLTIGKNSTKQSPLVICVNSDAEHQYSYEYNPLAQLLADRGLSVLCVDCHANTIYDDIKAVIKWCIKNRFTTTGNIYLSAKKSACEPAAKLFLDQPDLFAGCALLSSDIWDKLSAFSHMINKPMLLIDDMEEGDFKHLNVDDSIPVTYIGYTVRLRNSLSAALLEKFFATTANLPYIDISAKNADSLMVLIDGCDLIQQKQRSSDNHSSAVYDIL
ncbi:MAG: hypothetical protein K6C34_01895 [Alphaproteobacteria bacterium]|nr:hypothetical protein [Alphaproteobacteria bacterium]